MKHSGKLCSRKGCNNMNEFFFWSWSEEKGIRTNMLKNSQIGRWGRVPKTKVYGHFEEKQG
jgi:hypothetical protein